MFSTIHRIRSRLGFRSPPVDEETLEDVKLEDSIRVRRASSSIPVHFQSVNQNHINPKKNFRRQTQKHDRGGGEDDVPLLGALDLAGSFIRNGFS